MDQREHREIVGEILSLGERLPLPEGRIAGWQDHPLRPPQAAPDR